MSSVRPFRVEDARSVSELNAELFQDEPKPAPEFFIDVFLKNPWFDPHIQSLVHVEDDQTVTGFLGVVPRDIVYGSVTGRVAILSKFMVSLERRSSMAALKLLKQHFKGSQLVSIADAANESSRSVLTALGAETISICSLNWNRSIRRKLAWRFVRRVRSIPGFRRVTNMVMPIADLADSLIDAIPSFRRQPIPPEDLTVEELSVSDIVALGEKFNGRIMTFSYSPESIGRLFEYSKPPSSAQHDLCAKGVYDESHDLIGLFVYFVDAGRVASVLHMTSAPGKFVRVFRALIRTAWEHDVRAIRGRMNPELAVSFSGMRGLQFDHTEHWTVIYSKEASVLSAIRQGSLVLSKLECEWSTKYRG